MEKKNYLVVGGSSGIGLEIVTILKEKGHQVYVASRSNEKLKNMEGVEHIELDVLDDELSLDNLPDALHGLAYCPGTINLKPFRALKTKDFQHDFEVNALGAVKVLQAVEKRLKKEGGSVVLFSTVAVAQGMPFHASVATAKGAVEGLSRSLAAEFAPKVRVNCIAPSLTDTPLAEKLLANEDKREASAKRHPLEKVGSPKDIASMACFLLDGENAWISGQVFGIDGGMSRLKV